MAYQKGAVVAFLSCIWFHYSKSTSLSVPLLVWNNGESKLELPAITAGQTKELSVAYKNHVEPLIKSKPLLLLFLQDELSSDDFTKYASSFPHLQKILERKQYLLLPSVSKERESINELISSSTSHIDYVDSSSLNDWVYKPPADHTINKVIIFHLEPVRNTHSEGKREILRRNDLFMHRITKSLKEKVQDFSVVYSAEDPSQMIANILLDENIEDHSVTSRHLLTTVGNTSETFFNNTCVMMYVKSIRHVLNNNNATEFIKPWKRWKVGGCGSTSQGCSISITREGAFEDYENFTLFIEFKNDTQQWYCDLLRLSGQYKGQDFSYTFRCGSSNGSTAFDSSLYNTIVAPIGMSYACHESTFSTNNGTSVLTISGLQIQTFCDGRGTTKQFSSAYHCVGFFTIEILTVIFITIILMIGLYVGIMMMMAIQVQDRLDDPKGKTITVTALHNE